MRLHLLRTKPIVELRSIHLVLEASTGLHSLWFKKLNRLNDDASYLFCESLVCRAGERSTKMHTHLPRQNHLEKSLISPPSQLREERPFLRKGRRVLLGISAASVQFG